MLALKNLGLGGIVCNVDFKDYLVSETNWATLVKAIEVCREVGLVVWLYDEKGYPSCAAGGLVLKTNPDFEALELTYDPSRAEPFALRPAYEYSHAANNVHAARRYPNIMDDAAVRCFIAKTHDAYWERLRPHFGATVRAIFTDEPSLMAVNIGQIPEHIRKKVPVVDPLDSNVRPLPSVPWSRDLPQRFRERHGEDILPLRASLFKGDGEADRRVRRQFWALVADLVAERYFSRIQDWCHAHNIAATGHILWEENPLYHVPLEGNSLKNLQRMDIPGLDMLSSWPGAAIHEGWLAASLPASAALLNGGRRVMTEVSDYSQTVGEGRQQASLDEMRAVAAWQAALGVTEFTLYYGYRSREPKDYRAYCDFVGRLNALLRDASLGPNVLLYYPICDLWAEYLPVAGRLTLESQSPRMREIVGSFLRLGRAMVTAQISFVLTDHETLAAAEARDGAIWIKGHRFDAIVLPSGVELPEPAAKTVAGFVAVGGRVVRDESATALKTDRLAQLQPTGRLQPASGQIMLGCFVRERREILLLVNVGDKPYDGLISVKDPRRWWVADPANGRIERANANEAEGIAIHLPARGSIVLVSPPGP